MEALPLLFDDPPGVPLSTADSGRRWRGLLAVVLIFFGTRVVAWTGAYYGAQMRLRIRHQLEGSLSVHQRRWATQPAESQQELRSRQQLLADFAPLCGWDARHYRDIILRGYRYQRPSAGDRVGYNIAWFPLYPLVCRPLVSFMSVQKAMILVAHACGLAAAIALYLWARWRTDERVAIFAVTIAFSLPAASFYSFGYAESLTLLLAVLTLWLLDRRQFLWAALACGLASATRPTALPLAGIVLLCWWLNGGGSRRRRLWWTPVLLVLSVAGAAAYLLYLAGRFGSPLVYVENFRSGWTPDKDRASWLPFVTLTPVWEQFKYFRNVVRDFPEGLVNLVNPLMWNIPLTLFLLFVSLAGLKRVPRSFRALLLLAPAVFVYAYIAGGGAIFSIEPMSRYLVWAAPTLIVLSAWCVREWKPAPRAALLSFLVFEQFASAFRFALGEWCG
jgi:Gpi18-like mannosyltransferase